MNVIRPHSPPPSFVWFRGKQRERSFGVPCLRLRCRLPSRGSCCDCCSFLHVSFFGFPLVLCGSCSVLIGKRCLLPLVSGLLFGQLVFFWDRLVVRLAWILLLVCGCATCFRVGWVGFYCGLWLWSLLCRHAVLVVSTELDLEFWPFSVVLCLFFLLLLYSSAFSSMRGDRDL